MAFLCMLTEIPRFHRAARRLLADRGTGGGREAGASLGAFIDQHGFSRYFTAHFLLPLVSAVWSCPAGTALEYPACYLFLFLNHHGMLSVWGSPRWWTVTGGSRTYVDRVAKNLHRVRTCTPAVDLARTRGGVRIRGDHGTEDSDPAALDTPAS